MNSCPQSRSKPQNANPLGHDHFSESDSCIECFMRDDISLIDPLPLDTAHDHLINSLNRFLPTSNNVRINFLSKGHYSLEIRKTVIDIIFRAEATKILLSTTVYRSVYNKMRINSPPRVSRSRNYTMLTAMMKFKIMLDRSDSMESITSVNGKFIFQEVDFEILQENTGLHRILEGFILRSYEISQDFNRINKMLSLSEEKYT
jgi:hypothetical protein